MVETGSVNVTFAASGDVLHAHVQGPGTYTNTIKYWGSIVAALHERRPRGLLLVDETTGEPLTADEWKALVEAMGGVLPAHVRIAHVKPLGLQQIEYCELYAREAGIDARVFTNETEAMYWLRYGES